MNQIKLIKPHIESISIIENNYGNPYNYTHINKPVNLILTKSIEKHDKKEKYFEIMGDKVQPISVYTIYFNGSEVFWWFLNERDRDVHYNALVKPIDINFPIQESESQPD